MPKDKNGIAIAVGDVIKVRSVEKPGVVSVGPVVALNHAKDGATTGLVAWTRDGRVIEKAHFEAVEAEVVHKASEP